MAFVLNTCTQYNYKRFTFFFSIARITVRSFCEVVEGCAAASAGKLSCKDSLFHIANACSSVLTVFHFCVAIPRFLQPVWNEGLVTLCRFCWGSVAISVTVALSPVNRVALLSLILCIFVLDVRFICGSASDVEILCLSGVN